jgi:predicted RNA-binding Zn-ribbon protein involved in translation (DUF1610 family)
MTAKIVSKCPQCENDMMVGLIVGRSLGVKFKPQADILGDLTGIQLTEGIFNHKAPAARCTSCGIVVVFPPNKD